MPETVNSCPLCATEKSSLFDQREFRDHSVTNRICNACGLVFQSPRMTEEELAQFYEREYRRVYQGHEGPDPKDLAVQQRRAESLLAFSMPSVSGVGNHLDIGCGAGLLLQKFQAHYGCRSTGIEPGNAYRSYTQSQGVSVYPSLEALQDTHPNHFDMVSMAHVLEHIPQPVEYLRKLRSELLASDGWLLAEAPNLYCHDSFEIAHTVSYSPHTLAQTLEVAGFTIISLLQHGEPRSHLLPLYLTALARPAEESSRKIPVPERGVQRKRQFGLLHRKILTRLFPKRAWIPVLADQPREY